MKSHLNIIGIVVLHDIRTYVATVEPMITDRALTRAGNPKLNGGEFVVASYPTPSRED